ncbi:MAG: nickel ABC transporter permease subunit NikC [Peptococcaceae bacterium]|nr:nickel ABC transporter permease subunit NikC [Peptococcaceae bacterium]
MGKGIWRKLLRRRLAAASLLIIVSITLLGVLAPLLAPHDPDLVDLEKKLKPPSWDYPLGTDHLGRCILSRLMHGARITLGAAVVVMALTIAVSLLAGTFSGYVGGPADHFFMRLCDMMLAFPNLVLALAIVGMLGPGLVNIMIAMVAVQWVWYARIIRGMVLSVRERPFVLAAKVSGTGAPHIVLRHILPNIISQVVVLATLDIGWVVLSLSGFSFLGLGVQPPTPEWGAMLNDARPCLRSNPAQMVYPGLMILMVVMAFNLLGDALRDALDPSEK